MSFSECDWKILKTNETLKVSEQLAANYKLKSATTELLSSLLRNCRAEAVWPKANAEED